MTKRERERLLARQRAPGFVVGYWLCQVSLGFYGVGDPDITPGIIGGLYSSLGCMHRWASAEEAIEWLAAHQHWYPGATIVCIDGLRASYTAFLDREKGDACRRENGQ